MEDKPLPAGTTKAELREMRKSAVAYIATIDLAIKALNKFPSLEGSLKTIEAARFAAEMRRTAKP